MCLKLSIIICTYIYVNMLTRSSEWILNPMRYTGYMLYECYRWRIISSNHLKKLNDYFTRQTIKKTSN